MVALSGSALEMLGAGGHEAITNACVPAQDPLGWTDDGVECLCQYSTIISFGGLCACLTSGLTCVLNCNERSDSRHPTVEVPYG